MISFVIPAYNEEALIAKCIKSIADEMLARIDAGLGALPYEVIVVDNGSTDNTALIAKSQGAIVIAEPRKGITRARQSGFEKALYDIVAFIDADSVLAPGWVEFALTALRKLGVVAASGPVVYYDLRWFKRVAVTLFYCVGRAFHTFLPMLQGGNFILYKKALEEVGGFNTEIDFYGEDTDTATRLHKVGKVAFDLDMVIYTSGRRMDEEGFLRVGVRYVANYFWVWIFGEPWSTGYHDHRKS